MENSADAAARKSGWGSPPNPHNREKTAGAAARNFGGEISRNFDPNYF